MGMGRNVDVDFLMERVRAKVKLAHVFRITLIDSCFAFYMIVVWFWLVMMKGETLNWEGNLYFLYKCYRWCTYLVCVVFNVNALCGMHTDNFPQGKWYMKWHSTAIMH